MVAWFLMHRPPIVTALTLRCTGIWLTAPTEMICFNTIDLCVLYRGNYSGHLRVMIYTADVISELLCAPG